MEKLEPRTSAETLCFLARAPYENVYVAWLIEAGHVARGGATVALGRDAAGAIAGTCYLGAQVVPSFAADDSRLLEEFAREARAVKLPRMLVGERSATLALWAHTRDAYGAAAFVRACQPLYALTRASLQGGRRRAIVDRATRADLDEIVPHSARMIAGEIGHDPRERNADFAGRTARIIDAGWWWRYRVRGRLAFMCNIGAASAQTAQLQGVWSPPELRGQGHATRGLAAICDHLLDVHPSLCLYVNEFNAAAIALYERVGFRRVGSFATIGL